MAHELKYHAPDILLPIGYRIPVVVNQYEIPYSLRGQVSAGVTSQAQAQEIGHAFGRSAMPVLPVLVRNGQDSVVIMGDGVTEASELEDLAQMAIAEAKTPEQRKAFNEEQREKRGMPRSEDFDKNLRDALQRRIAHHKANPVTDPARVPQRPVIDGRKTFTVNGMKENK